MKRKFVFLCILFTSAVNVTFGQDKQDNNEPEVLYMGIVNVIQRDNFNFPLISIFANISKGEQHSPQLGFVNYNGKNFKSLQLGFANIVSDDNNDSVEIDGTQIGFVNIVTGKLSGLQLGFINYVKSVEKGVPVGFISVIEDGGYKAIELGYSDISPISFSFKIGVEKLYTSIIAGYDDESSIKAAFGIGLGSNLSVSKRLFINPEFNYITRFWGGHQQYFNLNTSLGIKLGNINFLVGPNFSIHNTNEQFREAQFKLYQTDINANNRFIIGAKAGVRYVF
jgi:hypothetical protein